MPQNLQLTRQPNGANIRASEGAGTTTLSDKDQRWQVFNLSAARTVVLPSDGSAGDVWQISNTGTGVLTLQSSGLNTITTFTGSSVVVASLIAAPTTAGNWLISPMSAKGVADNSTALAGNVGEYLGPGANLNNGTILTSSPTNIASISLTAGDWDVWGIAGFYSTPSSAGQVIWLSGSVSTTSATVGSSQTVGSWTGYVSGGGMLTVPQFQVSLSATTTVYIVGKGTVVTGTAADSFFSSQSQIFARRRR